MNYQNFQSLLILECLELGLAPPGSSKEEVTFIQKRKFRKLYKKYCKDHIEGLCTRGIDNFYLAYGYPGEKPTREQLVLRKRFVFKKIFHSTVKKFSVKKTIK